MSHIHSKTSTSVSQLPFFHELKRFLVIQDQLIIELLYRDFGSGWLVLWCQNLILESQKTLMMDIQRCFILKLWVFLLSELSELFHYLPSIFRQVPITEEFKFHRKSTGLRVYIMQNYKHYSKKQNKTNKKAKQNKTNKKQLNKQLHRFYCLVRLKKKYLFTFQSLLTLLQ